MTEELKETKVLITESTKEVVEEAIGEELEELKEEEVLQKVNASKKAVASLTETGEIKIQQSLNG